MNVGLKSDIFRNCTDEQLVAIKYLLYLCWYKNRHEVVLEGQLPQNIEDQLDGELLQLLKISSYARINGAECNCEIMKRGDDYNDRPWFSVDEGIRYLSQPFMLILENSKNDSKFITALIEIYGFDVLAKAIANGWMYYANAGGCTNVPNFIEGLLSQYQEKKKFLRCFVLLDSDALYPMHNNLKAAATKKYLLDNNIPHHIWEKRMLENYMPIEALPKGSDWELAYIHLSPQQMDHYAIHGGFKKDERFACDKKTTNRADLVPEQATFFNSVSDANYVLLYNGLELPNFKEAFPDLFSNRDNVNYDTLQERTAHQSNPNELKDVLEEIAQQLAM